MLALTLKSLSVVGVGVLTAVHLKFGLKLRNHGLECKTPFPDKLINVPRQLTILSHNTWCSFAAGFYKKNIQIQFKKKKLFALSIVQK